MPKKAAIEEKEEIVDLVCVSIFPIAPIEFRERIIQYRKTGKSYVWWSDEGDATPPYRLQKVRQTDLPKIGGFWDFNVLALTREDALKVLRAKILASQAKAQKELDGMTKGLQLVDEQLKKGDR